MTYFDEYVNKKGSLYYELSNNGLVYNEHGSYYLSKVNRTGRTLHDITAYGKLKSEITHPPVTVVQLYTNGIMQSNTDYTCFDRARRMICNDITEIKILNGRNGYKSVQLSKKDISKYVSLCKKHNIFPKTFTATGIISNIPMTIHMKDVKNSLHLYNIVCAYRNIEYKPQTVKNALSLYEDYKLTWYESMVISCSITNIDKYYSIFNLGLGSYIDLFTPIKNRVFNTSFIKIFEELCTNPSLFGDTPVTKRGFSLPDYFYNAGDIYDRGSKRLLVNNPATLESYLKQEEEQK